jgi:hypothetical protein
LNWLDQRANFKKGRQAIQDAFDAQTRCEEYLGMEIPENQEDVNIINNSSTLQKQRWIGCPTIDYSIRVQQFDNALCNLGASVSVMPKAIFDKLPHAKLDSTSMCQQLADQSLRYPVGITENILVKIREFFILVDFVVLDVQPDSRVSLILGRQHAFQRESNLPVTSRKIRPAFINWYQRFQVYQRRDL